MIARSQSREIRLSVMAGFLVLFGVLLPVGYIAAAVGAEMWGMLAGVPTAVLGAVLVVVGEGRRLASDGGKIGVSVLGGVLVVGSVWVAFMTDNAFLS